MGFSKFVLVPVVLIVLVSGSVGGKGKSKSKRFEFEEKELATEESLWKLYDRWGEHHTIWRGLKEKTKRFGVFKENVKHVFAVNQMKKAYKLKLNKFADMSNYEFVRLYAASNIREYRKLVLNGGERRKGGSGFMYEDVPSSIDWRERGAVNEIKEQGKCGSCWAFSSVAAVEAINQIKTNQLLSLSEQELLDCNTRNRGCNGGFMEYAFDFITQNGGIATETNYPYQGATGFCRSSTMGGVRIDGYESVPENENALMQAVANQPVSVAVDAAGRDFQFYSEGVFDGYCGTELNHGVVVIGYGTTTDDDDDDDDDQTDYWIVRNSWGLGWGEDGYIRIKRGVEDPQGLCGIVMEASYPLKF